MTRLVALLGDPVAHSLSPAIQNAAFEEAGVDGIYLPLRVSTRDFGGLLRGIARAGGAGNVTLPHKELAHEVVDVRTPEAAATGAVNTFWLEDGLVHGDNTDVEGFRVALREILPDGIEGGHVLLLGAGGAARAVLLALEAEGAARVQIRNRTPSRAVDLVRTFGSAGTVVEAIEADAAPSDSTALVVNATRLGLHPGDPLPADPGELPRDAVGLDLVYGPAETPWVRALRSGGHRAADGGTMLAGQGAAAFRRWWGLEPPLHVFRDALDRLRVRDRGKR